MSLAPSSLKRAKLAPSSKAHLSETEVIIVQTLQGPSNMNENNGFRDQLCYIVKKSPPLQCMARDAIASKNHEDKMLIRYKFLKATLKFFLKPAILKVLRSCEYLPYFVTKTTAWSRVKSGRSS